MFRGVISLSFSLIIVISFHAFPLSISGGIEGGTYNSIARDLQKILSKAGINMRVISTAGAWQNILNVIEGKTDLAITQLDAYVLASYLYKKKFNKDISEKLQIIFKLYPEEIHVLTRKNARISNVYDLNNKYVSCGEKNSGSCITAEMISSLYNIKFTMIYMPFKQAIQALIDGKVDAIILTVGKPASLLNEVRDVKLINLPKNSEMDKYFIRTTIDPQDYPWNSDTIGTYAIPSILIADGTLNNKMIGKIVLSILSHESFLKANGHPKWKEVGFSSFYVDIMHPIAIKLIKVCIEVQNFGFTCDGMKVQR